MRGNSFSSLFSRSSGAYKGVNLRRAELSHRSHLARFSAMAQQQKKASIVNVGLPWDDDRLHTAGPMTPLKVKEGIETINRLMAEHGFEKFTSIQYV